MPEENVEAPKTLSIADALKEGVKGASQSGTITFSDLDGASKAAVILLAVGAESAANVLRQMTPFEVQLLSDQEAARVQGGYAGGSSVTRSRVQQRTTVRTQRCGTARPAPAAVLEIKDRVKAAAASAAAALPALCDSPWLG